MNDHQAILAELEEVREGAATLMRARLETAANQVRELATRIAGDIGVVIPPDLETLFPLASVSTHLEELAKRPAASTITLEALRRLDAGRAQSEVLQELLRQLAPFCGRCCIVVFRDGQVNGWAGAGFASGNPVRSWQGTLAASTALSRVAAGTPILAGTADDSVLSGWFGAESRLLLVPMSLRGKVVGALIAAEADGRLEVAVIQHLTFLAGLLLESLNVRPIVPTPSLQEPLDLIQPAAAEAEPIFAPAEEEPLPVEQPTVPPSEPAVPMDVGATVQLKTPVTPAVAPPPPAPPAEAPLRTPEEERKHEEAKRFARLLVSEIRLYNETAVQAGKTSRDIYQRLKEDIDRSREMYEQRVPAEVRAQSHYFVDELIRILADGDEDALGM
jgi:hypothetical protein